jgi:hypothetical protein
VAELTTRSNVKKIPPRKNRGGDNIDVRWWKLSGEEAAQSVLEVVRAIENESRVRFELFERYACQYLDLKPQRGSTGTGHGSLLARLTPSNVRAKRASTNVTQSVVDTAGAHTAKNRPRPIFLTSGGDYALHLQGRQLTRFIDGLFAMMKIHVTGLAVDQDARIFGTGLGYHYLHLETDDSGKVIDGEIRVERVLLDEMRISDDESRNGMPVQMHRVRPMMRDELIEMFPDKEKEIIEANPARGTREEVGLVEVIDSWHLPTGRVRYEKDDAGNEDRKRPITDGRFMTTLGGEIELWSAPYTKSYFPILPRYWSNPLAGFWGRGLCEELQGKQKQINDYDADIAQSLKMSAKIKWLVPEDGAIDSDGISDIIGEQIKYQGATPPTPIIPPAVSPELYAHRKTMIAECYEMTGVSQSQATARKEPGLNSGIGIREQNDINSTRFVLKAQGHEQWFMDSARICIDLARELYDVHGIDLKVKGRAGKFIETIPWSKVNLKNDAFDMQMFPVSLLPTTPQGRLETLSEMVGMGAITADEMRRLMDFPDLEDFNSLATAQFDYAAWLVSELLEGGEYDPPDNRMDLKMISDVALANYARALRMRVPERILENLRQLMDECELWLEAVAAGVDIRKPAQFAAWLEGRADVPPPPPELPPDAMAMG